MNVDRGSVRLAALRLAGPVLVRLGTLGQPDRAVQPDAPRILVIRPDHLGDVLLTTPVAGLLRDALPGAQVDWLVGPWAADLARRCGRLAVGAGESGEVLTLEFPGFTRRPKGSATEPYRLLLREAARLRARAYDAAFIARPDHWWGGMLAAAAGIPCRFGFAVPETLPFLTDTLPVPTGHVVRSNQALARLAVARLGGRQSADDRIVAPHFPILAEEAAWAACWDNSRRAQASRSDASAPGDDHWDDGPLVAIHPGSGGAVKNWLPGRWSDVIREIRKTHRARVVLTGGTAERQLVESIAARLDPPPATLAGETTLGQLAALFARCDLVLGCDSGPLHLAAAVGTPTVRLYGPTDILEFGPWPAGEAPRAFLKPDFVPPTPRHCVGEGRQIDLFPLSTAVGRGLGGGASPPVSGLQIALAAGLPCQPCRDFAAPPCGATDTPACLRAIRSDAVVEATRQVLERC